MEYHATFVFLPYSKIDAMPMAPALLKAICDNNGLKTTTVDLNVETQRAYRDTKWATEIEKYIMYFSEMSEEAHDWYHQYIEGRAKELIAMKSNWIGLSLLSFQSLCFAHDLCFYIKKNAPNQKIILGGPGISKDDNVNGTYKNNKKMSDTMLETKLCDAVVVNESENLLIDILTNNKTGKFNTNTQISQEELNQLPAPSYIDYKFDLYESSSTIFAGTATAAATITGSKGCVRRCTFCDVFTFEPKYVFKDGNKIADEMIEIYETQGIKNFFMSDSLINGSMKAFRQMNEALAKKLPRTLSYYGEYIARPEGQTTSEDYDLMALAGCKHVTVGIESGSEAVRNHMRKKFTNEDLSVMIESLEKVGITQEWNLMTGYVTETRKDFEETLALVKKYKDFKFPNVIVNPVGVLHLLPGSPLYDTHARQLEIEWEDVKQGVGLVYQYWKTSTNPENTFFNRTNWWIELLELCNKYKLMTEHRYKQKKTLAERMLQHWKENKA